MSHLSEKDLASLKERLEKEAGETEVEVKSTSKPKDFGSDVDHFDEEADEAEEFSNNIDVTQTLKGRLQDIEVALDKMTKGTYGICEKCGGDISLEVLKVDPESRLCRDCKLK